MACPCFYPTERLGPARSILPLGDAWAGECRVSGCEPAACEGTRLLKSCNLGYARGACGRFPLEGPDAVRFSITRRTAAVVSVCCVVEREYLPFSRSTIVYDADGRRFVVPHPDPTIGQQALAYVETYLLRTQR
ncbi:MAG TPA: hypothetical protein VN442_26210 [Bryobacteraceae bacterium]|nr:hypothetical protein [Bryobacteraceae bacterium]